MQEPFSLVIRRDSVCAGDDGDAPHELALSVSRDVSLRDFIDGCRQRHYLASISGGEATWVLASVRPLAVIAQQWSEPRFLVAPESPVLALIDASSNPHLGFRYLCQIDPEQVLAGLARGEKFAALQSPL